MTNKKITWGLVGIVVIYFVAYFSVQRIIINTGTNIQQSLVTISQLAQQGKWQEALELIDETKQAWESKKPIIMLNFGEDELTDININLARIKAGIIAEDLPSILTEIAATNTEWSNIITIVPEP